MSTIAKPILKDKFWIVEEQGKRVGTLQKSEEGLTLTIDRTPFKYPTVRALKAKHNIVFEKAAPEPKTPDLEVHGYPVKQEAFNQIYDVQHRLPLFTKQEASKSFFAAGHYMIEFKPDHWVHSFCPKFITLKRYKYVGPFKTEFEARAHS